LGTYGASFQANFALLEFPKLINAGIIYWSYGVSVAGKAESSKFKGEPDSGTPLKVKTILCDRLEIID
jgi:hypothetical protein